MWFLLGTTLTASFFDSLNPSAIAQQMLLQAMLQSIGMTGRQLKQMLSYEGLYYAVGTIMVSLIVGVLFSFIIVQAITSSFWFFTYHFVIWPMLVVYPFLILLTAIIPTILYREFAKSSIIERLHQN